MARKFYDRRPYLQGGSRRRGDQWHFSDAQSKDGHYRSHAYVDENPRFRVRLHTNFHGPDGNKYASKIHMIDVDKTSTVNKILRDTGFVAPAKATFQRFENDDKVKKGVYRYTDKGATRQVNGVWLQMDKFEKPKK